MNQNLNIAHGVSGSKSLWMEVEISSFPPLDMNMDVDVCIVGAGIVGLTCAYTLAKQGKSVVVLDQGIFPCGQSSRTTAHLSWVLDDRYHQLENYFGVEGAAIAAESHSASIDYIEKIVEEEGIDCDFERVDGFLFHPPDESQDILDKEYFAIKKIGMQVQKIPRAPFSATFDTGACLQFPRQAQFHMHKYLNGLIKAILKYGGKIFNNTHVKQFEDGTPCFAKTESGFKVNAQALIVATCTPINNRFIIHTKQAAYRTYVIAATVPKDSVPKGLYWDTADPYHYLRIQKHLTDPGLDWLIVGGEDHKTGQDNAIRDRYDYLEQWTRKRFPDLKKIEYRWSGQVFEPVDSLAFIGSNPGDKNIYIATGDSGNGLTHGTIAGILLPDLILGKPNRWRKLYDPSRKTLSAAPKFIAENLNVALQYADWFTPGELKKIDQLPPDEGVIMRKGLKKLAVYKDKDKKVHVNSAFCPHLGGCVNWNNSEKCWDCPCHGSQFDGCGKVTIGPAISNLFPCQEESFNN